MSILLSISSTDAPNDSSHNFTVQYDRLNLDPNYEWELALLKASIPYSFFNVQASQTTNTFVYSPDNGATNNIVTIPDGVYSLPEIQAYFESVMNDNGDFTLNPDNTITYHITLTANTNTLRTNIEIDTNYELDLTGSNFYRLLGFEALTVASPLTVGTYVSDNLADLNDGISNLLIKCNLVESSYLGNSRVPNIYSFVPTVRAGSTIVIDVANPVYLLISALQRDIRDITMSITDQTGALVNFNDEPISYLLHIRVRRRIA